MTALEHGAEVWQFGEEERTAYEATLYTERAVAPPVAITITCGIEPDHVGGMFAPNRCTLWIRRDAPDEVARPDVIQAVLTAAAERLGADFGYVGTATFPAPAEPVRSLGIPPVGWMTFLSKERPHPPAKLPTPAVAHGAGSAGTVIVAHPNLYREHVKAHREAVVNVTAALNAAGVLQPSVRERA